MGRRADPPVTAYPSCRSCFCLFAAVLLDLLELGLCQLARHVVAGDLGALHVVPDVFDDLGVGQGGHVPDIGDVTTLANPEVVEDIRHHVQSAKVARDDVPRQLTEAEFEEIKKYGAE